MKKILIFLFLSLSLSAQVRKSEDLKFDLLHTELHVKPIWSNQTLEGNAILTLKPYFYPQSVLELDAKDFIIKKISLKGQELPYTFDGRKVNISLGKQLQASDTLKIAIDYIAQPEKIKAQALEENKSEKGLFFINPLGETKGMPTQFWTQGETQSSSAWFPTLDSPNQNHTQDIYITLEKKYTTLSNGVLVDSKDEKNGLKTDHWAQNLPHAVYLTMIAAGDFVKVTDPNFKRFEVSYYLEPEYAKNALGIFGRTPEMINYFEQLLGVKYPWQKYAQVPIRKFISGAMENTTATTHAAEVLKNEHQLVDANDDAVIAHELFHHWFGNLVTCESWSQLPLNESFANYSEYLWANHKYGKDEGDYTYLTDLQNYLAESQSKNVPMIRFNYASSEDMFDAHSYQKGGRILHTLRNEIGDKAFFETLKNYLNKFAFQTVEIEDLRTAFEKTTGQDLKWFFDQWFKGTGHPLVSIKSAVEEQNLKLQITQQTDSLGNGVFRVKLPLRVVSNESIKDTVLQLSLAEESFIIPFKGKFENYVPNADGYFLGVVTDDRIQEQNIQQYDNSPEIYARIIGLETALARDENPLQNKELRDLVIRATKDKFWRIRQLAVQKLFDYDGDDFLKVEKTLEKVIQEDVNSNVRADALLAVKDFQNPFHIELARKAMTDSSYSVRASALEILLSNNVPESDSLVAVYENINDNQVFGVVANNFVQQNKSGKTQWMLDRLAVMEGFSLYQYLGILGSYLVMNSENEINMALPFLRNAAINESAWYTRLSALRVLMAIKDSSAEADTIYKEALDLEKDEKILNYLQQFNVEG